MTAAFIKAMRREMPSVSIIDNGKTLAVSAHGVTSDVAKPVEPQFARAIAVTIRNAAAKRATDG